jgi:hypothetical protein
MQYQTFKTTEEIFPTYFPYFNHTLFIEEAEFSKENDFQMDYSESQMSEESSTNTSHSSIKSLDEKEKLIPLNLLDISPVKNPSTVDDELVLNPINLLELFTQEEKKENKKIKPELQKYILPKSLFDNTKKTKKEFFEELDEKKLNAKPFIPSKYRNQTSIKTVIPADFCCPQNKNCNIGFNYELKLNNKKKKFIERQGDWRCSKCKNINFSFRNKCNKCQISKEESENYFVTLGKNVFKLDKNFINLHNAN